MTTIRVDPIALRTACEEEGVDERTAWKALRGEPVRGRAGVRAARVIARVTPSELSNPPRPAA